MMGAMLRRLGALLAVAGVLLAAPGLSACGEDREAGEIVRFAAGKRPAAPGIGGELLGGGAFDLAAQRGKVVVVNFWGSWCQPCRVEADDLEAVHKALPEVGFIGINIRDDRDKALAFMRDRSTYPSIFDPAGRLALKFEQVPPNTIPATIILDRQGRIAIVIRKALLQEDLRAMVDEVTAESKG
jgi:thiol-disulfide isomerase/thioredoxin